MADQNLETTSLERQLTRMQELLPRLSETNRYKYLIFLYCLKIEEIRAEKELIKKQENMMQKIEALFGE
jgi:GTPase SAR1 family protein